MERSLTTRHTSYSVASRAKRDTPVMFLVQLIRRCRLRQMGSFFQPTPKNTPNWVCFAETYMGATQAPYSGVVAPSRRAVLVLRRKKPVLMLTLQIIPLSEYDVQSCKRAAWYGRLPSRPPERIASGGGFVSSNGLSIVPLRM